MHCQHRGCNRLLRATGARGPLPSFCREHRAERDRELKRDQMRRYRERQRNTETGGSAASTR